MSKEGSLDAPVRHPIDFKHPDFLNPEKLDAEMRRVFDICHGCRRCFNLCDSFPKLFDMIDESENENVESISSDQFASVFRSTAEGETGHAHGHLEYLEEVGDPATGLPIGETKANLASAVQGETHEYTDMYPGMAKTAREEGFEEIADWFETLAKAEKSHAGKFQKTLESIS